MADRSYTVTRDVRVAAPPSAVYAELVDFRRWRSWSPFEDLDPGMDRTYSGATDGVGAVYAWSGSPKVGVGRMEITAADDGARVVVEQRNDKPLRSQSTSTFTLVGADGGTLVTWSSSGTLSRLMRVVGVVVPMEKVLGPVFERGLERLRQQVAPGT